ncbi:alpha/beta hydrolase [Undibacterium sp.]|uniref:alpha/beta hydrolase n=1 Tax=Undibacterium sp. TaxID=1914977 RepID=UPI003750B043
MTISKQLKARAACTLVGLSLLFSLLPPVSAQSKLEAVPISFTFAEKGFTGEKSHKLEAFEYIPVKWNNKVIVMSHGSTGGKPDAIKASIQYKAIASEATRNGYVFVVYMRKGRGKSEGDFTEETGKCDFGSLRREQAEAEAQLEQVIEQVKVKHTVQKVILMGHSRGGFLSSTYAAKKPESVLAVVNLAGAWSAACENKNNNMGRKDLEESSNKFAPQFWAYFDADTYFMADKFNDPGYVALSRIAMGKVTMRTFDAEGMSDGHATPTFKPKAWAAVFFPMLAEIK